MMLRNFYLLLVLTFFFSFQANAQLEKVIVETYYISDSTDATDTTGGGLAAGSKTYRIYVDLAPGYRLYEVFGNADHSLKFSSTQYFFNNKVDGQSFGKDFPKSRLKENTVALDTWLTLGQTTKYTATKTYFGVPKPDDADGSFIGGANNNGGSAGIVYGLLSNNNPIAGIPLTTADGMYGFSAPSFSWLSDGIQDFSGNDSTIFGSVIQGNQFVSNAAYLQCMEGMNGVVPDSNQILIAQLTTQGGLAFELNIKILSSVNDTIIYVASDSINILPGEILSSWLKYPYVQTCGCPDPRYLEYLDTRDCDNSDLCQNLIVFGCMDTLACNYDPEANFNLTELCCYPGYCNDRDLSIVCPSITSTNRELNIYPIPAQHHLILEIYGTADAAAHYIIYNAFGKILKEKNISIAKRTTLHQVDVSNLETGLYLIQLFTGENTFSKVFMKN